MRYAFTRVYAVSLRDTHETCVVEAELHARPCEKSGDELLTSPCLSIYTQ